MGISERLTTPSSASPSASSSGRRRNQVTTSTQEAMKFWNFWSFEFSLTSLLALSRIYDASV